MNKSPWTSQLIRNRPLHRIKQDISTDVAIIGGGIAGISTAFFILENTKLNVTLIEAGKVAHGATGHNAGQVVMYFERPFSSIVKEFGSDMAIEGQKNIIDTWKLLRHIHKTVGVHTHLAEFMGYAGLSNMRQIESHLEDTLEIKKAGLNMERLLISKEFLQTRKINKKYHGSYSVVPHKKIMTLLETNNPEYVAVLAGRKGLVNSAIFTEETAEYLAKKYPKRVTIFEESPVKKIELYNGSAQLHVRSRTVSAKNVVMCTNGFHNIDILNKYGSRINQKFHRNVHGEIGYMAGYLEEFTKDPTAISYFRRESEITESGESYFYLTRRTYHKDKKAFNLISVNDVLQRVLKRGQKYNSESHPYPMRAKSRINTFLRENYKHSREDRVEFHYLWHGLMGYTHNMLRMIGPDPVNPALMYNLGCNGAGILSSIYGASKIAGILQGRKFKPSIFDPYS